MTNRRVVHKNKNLNTSEGILHFPVNTFVVYLGARATRLRMVKKSGQAARAPSTSNSEKCKLYERRPSESS